MSQQQNNIYKIYSRNRIRLGFSKNNRKNRKYTTKIKKILPFFIITIIAFITCYNIINAINPIFETLCEDEAKAIATRITNEQSTIVIEKYGYNDFFTIEKDENNNVKMITANVLKINEITSDIAIYIQKELDKSCENEMKIAMGSVTGVKVVSGFGPKIKIKISTAGTVDTDLKSEFQSQGINQTLHRVYLEVRCNVSILTPFSTIQKTITNQVLLTENVIVGEIPANIFNLNN